MFSELRCKRDADHISSSATSSSTFASSYGGSCSSISMLLSAHMCYMIFKRINERATDEPDVCEVCDNILDCGAPLTVDCLRNQLCEVHAHWAQVQIDCRYGIAGPCPVLGLCGARRLRDGLFFSEQESLWRMTPDRAHRVAPNRCTADIPLWVLEDGNNLLRPLNYYIKLTLRDELGRVGHGQFILHISNAAYVEDENDIVDHCEAVKTCNGDAVSYTHLTLPTILLV
eukprot:8726516-Pyramimonas_sp.AAC.2